VETRVSGGARKLLGKLAHDGLLDRLVVEVQQPAQHLEVARLIGEKPDTTGLLVRWSGFPQIHPRLMENRRQ
jgi:hypothetical protein